MTSLRDGSFVDITSESVKAIPEARAVAYAVGRQVARICDAADKTAIYCGIDRLDEHVVDQLAQELRVPSYDQTYRIDIKRELVRGALLFWMQTGTPAAVNRIIKDIFSDGEVVEWWMYSGDPHHFKARTSNPAITSSNVDEFISVLDSVKRLSSWLDEVLLDLSTDPALVYLGHWIHTGDFIRLSRATM